MKAADWQDAENYRNHVIAEIFEFCATHGLDANATEKKLTIKLPTVKELSVMPEHEKTKRFDISKWGPTGIDETQLKNIDDIVQTTDGPPYAPGEMPDELPPANYTLEEGVPPTGDDEK